jgi:hypothetical protein
MQFSATSHGPALARQTVLDELNKSVGQMAEVPVHFSAGSHIPALSRQTEVDDLNESAGHVSEPPVQYSGKSHDSRYSGGVPPTIGRQILLSEAKVQLSVQQEFG